MAYRVRVRQLSGQVVSEVELPETARVVDILAIIDPESKDPLLKRTLVYKQQALEPTDALCQLLPASPAIADMQLVIQSRRLTRVTSLPEGCPVLHLGLFGEQRAGKTSLLYRFTQNTFKDRTVLHTAGIDFQVARVMAEDFPVKVFLWDQPGKERFRRISELFFRRKLALLLVIDLTNPESFRDISEWMDFDEARAVPTKLLLGNKADLTRYRRIPRETAEKYASERGLIYVETSAKDGTGADTAMERAIFDVLAKASIMQPVLQEPPHQSKGRCQFL
mmetsp:Transcript_8348/g.15188  ORF Transcript_8348/g.15188 Transcript_8348/m.15188 type:complete len:279 (-) Transcript_8348:60-896(-)